MLFFNVLVFECVVFWRNFTYYSAGKIFTLLPLAVTNITPVREIERNCERAEERIKNGSKEEGGEEILAGRRMGSLKAIQEVLSDQKKKGNLFIKLKIW